MNRSLNERLVESQGSLEENPPMPSRRADQTATRLLDATHALLVERAGRGASVSEICARAEVNVAMVKYCFGSKDALLDALLERALRQLAAELERLAGSELPPEAKLRRHVAEVVRNYVRFPYVNRLMNERLLAAEPDAVDRISRSFARPARDWYATLLAEGRLQAGWRELDPTLFFFAVVGLCEFLFSARPLLERAFGESIDAGLVERYSAQVADLVIGGVAAVAIVATNSCHPPGGD
jgi:TetR/AcrR family transcriptional regulator